MSEDRPQRLRRVHLKLVAEFDDNTTVEVGTEAAPSICDIEDARVFVALDEVSDPSQIQNPTTIWDEVLAGILLRRQLTKRTALTALLTRLQAAIQKKYPKPSSV